MARIDPLDRDDLVSFERLFQAREEDMGFTSNSMLTMARWPELLEAWMNLGRETMFKPSEISQELKALVAHLVSRSSGCLYCTAHSGNHSVNKVGIAAEKIEKLFEYERDPIFSDAERAALRVAQAGGNSTDSDFEEVKKHFSERQVVEIVAVASFMSFLNRWNDTLAVELEDWPHDFAKRHLSEGGWEIGKHAKSRL